MISAHLLSKAQPLISDEQKQNLQILITDLQASLDGSLSDMDLSPLVTAVQDAWSDRTLTPDDIESILTAAMTIGANLGITAQEARTLFYDLQNIAQASCLPRTDDHLTGTSGNDGLYGGLGNDTLTGVGSTTVGAGEVDWLMGGGGNDTFVLGDTMTTFYNDNNLATVGADDYAILVDYNPTQDQIQLHGVASDYVLGAIPISSGMTGTAIFYQPAGQRSTAELIGIVAGVTLTDFNAGFAFVNA